MLIKKPASKPVDLIKFFQTTALDALSSSKFAGSKSGFYP